jgi:tripartite-type tricarboxylate transporter receptor subunit TctC
MPEVPTLQEAGIDGVDVTQWYALFAPAGTPAAVVERINKALDQVLSDPEIIERIERNGALVETCTPEQLQELVQSELAKWRGVVQQARLAEQSAFNEQAAELDAQLIAV